MNRNSAFLTALVCISLGMLAFFLLKYPAETIAATVILIVARRLAPLARRLKAAQAIAGISRIVYKLIPLILGWMAIYSEHNGNHSAALYITVALALVVYSHIESNKK
jgi:hypothetical protein